MNISARRTVTLLAICAAGLAIVGIYFGVAFPPDAFHAGDPRPAKALIRLFELDGEANLPTWFESMLFLIAAGLSLLVSGGTPRKAFAWRLMAFALVVMSCDEVSSIHETVGIWLSHLMAAKRLYVYAWLIPGGLVTAGLVWLTIQAMRPLDPAVRRGVALGGLIFLFGAFGLEIVEAIVDASVYGTWIFGLISSIEETLELVGLLVFIHALMGHLRDHPAEALLTITE